MRLIKLHFTAPVHFGDGRLTDSAFTCAADTLFSALFIEALGQGCANELLEAAHAGNLSISDAFPFIGSTLYLPKPQLSPQVRSNKANAKTPLDSTEKKAFKKLSYIASNSLVDYFAGTLKAGPAAEALSCGIGVSGLATKVNLRREERDEAEPYQVGGFRFGDEAGLYFLVEGDFDIEPLLETLQFSGLGGKRSTGYGRFEYEFGDMCGLLDDAGMPTGKYMLLSTAAPTQVELTDELLQGAAYSLKKRSGFVQSGNYAASPVKRRDLYAFKAGSVFEKRFNGDVFDVSLGGAHPVWRYAKAMWLEG